MALFRATAQTLLTIAADPKHLGAKIAFFAAPPGALTCSIILICTVWSLAAVSLRMAVNGFAAGMSFSCPCGCSQGCFVVCSWSI